MYLDTFQQSQYPKFTRYLRDDFPKLLDVPGIIAGMRAWGFMEMDDIRDNLQWWEAGAVFRGAQIEIREVSESEFGYKKGRTFDEVRRDGIVSGEVNVSPSMVREFERGYGVAGSTHGVRRTAYGRRIYAIGAEMLGQIVYHYAHGHLWDSKTNTAVLDGMARARRQAFFGQCYGGTPR